MKKLLKILLINMFCATPLFSPDAFAAGAGVIKMPTGEFQEIISDLHSMGDNELASAEDILSKLNILTEEDQTTISGSQADLDSFSLHFRRDQAQQPVANPPVTPPSNVAQKPVTNPPVTPPSNVAQKPVTNPPVKPPSNPKNQMKNPNKIKAFKPKTVRKAGKLFTLALTAGYDKVFNSGLLLGFNAGLGTEFGSIKNGSVTYKNKGLFFVKPRFGYAFKNVAFGLTPGFIVKRESFDGIGNKTAAQFMPGLFVEMKPINAITVGLNYDFVPGLNISSGKNKVSKVEAKRMAEHKFSIALKYNI